MSMPLSDLIERGVSVPKIDRTPSYASGVFGGGTVRVMRLSDGSGSSEILRLASVVGSNAGGIRRLESEAGSWGPVFRTSDSSRSLDKEAVGGMRRKDSNGSITRMVNGYGDIDREHTSARRSSVGAKEEAAYGFPGHARKGSVGEVVVGEKHVLMQPCQMPQKAAIKPSSTESGPLQAEAPSYPKGSHISDLVSSLCTGFCSCATLPLELFAFLLDCTFATIAQLSQHLPSLSSAEREVEESPASLSPLSSVVSRMLWTRNFRSWPHSPKKSPSDSSTDWATCQQNNAEMRTPVQTASVQEDASRMPFGLNRLKKWKSLGRKPAKKATWEGGEEETQTERNARLWGELIAGLSHRHWWCAYTYPYLESLYARHHANFVHRIWSQTTARLLLSLLAALLFSSSCQHNLLPWDLALPSVSGSAPCPTTEHKIRSVLSTIAGVVILCGAAWLPRWLRKPKNGGEYRWKMLEKAVLLAVTLNLLWLSDFSGAIIALLSGNWERETASWPAAEGTVLLASLVLVSGMERQRFRHVGVGGIGVLVLWVTRVCIGWAPWWELLSLGSVCGTLAAVAYGLDQTLLDNFMKTVLVKHEISMSFTIIRNLLPKHVIKLLMVSGPLYKPPCDRYDSVSVLFADIVGFTKMSSNMTPQQLVDMLNDVFSIFDRLALQHRVHKIETIGDCYYCATGMPDPDPEHADHMLRMAMDMHEATRSFTSPTGEPVVFRIGVHSGPVVAGVVGSKMPRYHLFGRTVRLASALEQSGRPGRIHVSKETRSLLSQEFDARLEGEDPMVFCSDAKAKADIINADVQ